MRQRRPLIEQYRRAYGLPGTVRAMDRRLNDLLLAPREIDGQLRIRNGQTESYDAKRRKWVAV